MGIGKKSGVGWQNIFLITFAKTSNWTRILDVDIDSIPLQWSLSSYWVSRKISCLNFPPRTREAGSHHMTLSITMFPFKFICGKYGATGALSILCLGQDGKLVLRITPNVWIPHRGDESCCIPTSEANYYIQILVF